VSTTKEKKLLEEESWEEAYDQMFCWFHKCANKTSRWGNPNCWDTDWKQECGCENLRIKAVVLVDLLGSSSFVNFIQSSSIPKIIRSDITNGTNKSPFQFNRRPW
jgi:hypothetical protein